MNKAFIFLLMAMLVTPVCFGAFAQNKVTESKVCSTSTTLAVNQSWLYSNGSVVDVSESQLCPNGCNTILDVCNPPEFILYTIGFLIFLIILVVVLKVV